VDEEGSDSVMLHDYHLYLASRTVKALRPAVTLQQFVHIPWPAPHAWEALPPKMVSAMCRGLLGNDSLAFQTEESVEHFLATCSIYLRDEVDVKAASGEVRRNGRTTTVWSNPISVEVRALREELESSEAARYRALLEVERASCERLIVRVDRLDPSKDIAGGFRAYERLLEGRPEWRGKVRFLAFLVPSRTSIPEYASYAREVMSLVERINRRFGTPGWQPLRVVHEHNRLQALAGLELYDVLLVNSVADGMNLVAKEGPVLNQRDGVLVLSTSAGSYAELRRGAVGVPPGDEAATSAALDLALRMPAGERRARAEELRACIERHQLADWLRLLLKDMTIRGYVRELSRAGSHG
jgi:trehalose 6-phosphate synthase